MSEAKPCQNIERNNERCTCPKTECPRHGICCECVAQHLNAGNLPQCYVKAGFALK